MPTEIIYLSILELIELVHKVLVEEKPSTGALFLSVTKKYKEMISEDSKIV